MDFEEVHKMRLASRHVTFLRPLLLAFHEDIKRKLPKYWGTLKSKGHSGEPMSPKRIAVDTRNMGTFKTSLDDSKRRRRKHTSHTN
jgi:hypothetical protein